MASTLSAKLKQATSSKASSGTTITVGTELRDGHVLILKVVETSGNNTTTTVSQLELDAYIANIDGNLTWKLGGDYSKSSKSIAWDDPFVKATCTKADGTSVNTQASINLNDHISIDEDCMWVYK